MSKPPRMDLSVVMDADAQDEYNALGDRALIPANPYEESKLFSMISEGSSPMDVQAQLLMEAAKEVAFMQATRELLYNAGGNISGLSEKIVKSIKTVGDINAVRSKELQDFMKGEIDFSSEGFSNIIKFLLKLFKENLQLAGVPNNLVNTTFQGLQASMMGFEEKAKRLYGGASFEEVTKAASDKIQV